MPCSLVEAGRYFGETYCIVIRGGRLSQAIKQARLATSCFFVLYFDPEDGGSHVHSQKFLMGGSAIFLETYF
jgi:hypothetical protein